MFPTSEEIAQTFNKPVKIKTDKIFIFHVVGIGITYTYDVEKFLFTSWIGGRVSIQCFVEVSYERFVKECNHGFMTSLRQTIANPN